jgi:hypothetical protein
MNTQVNPVNSKEVIEFVAIATEYCTFVENTEKLSINDFVKKAHEVLINIYQKAIYLPELTAKYEDFNEHHVTEKEYEKIQKKIYDKLGHYDSYHDVNNPVKQLSDKPSGECISEDMSDIFQEIKDFVMLFRSSRKELMYEAIWECSQSFKNYWGQRLTNSLRALHFLQYSGEELAELSDEYTEDEGDNIDEDLDTSQWLISEE